MQIKAKLYSILREKLPPENKGEVIVELPTNSCIQDLLNELEINSHVVVSVNDEHQPELHHPLNDGDHIRVFTIIGGGSS